MNRSRRAPAASAFIAALLSLAAAPFAGADVVRLEVGPDLFGQGWMFLDTDGRCKVVTAAHVVRAPDGTLRLPSVRDSRGREWTTGPALVLSADPDIAVLAVPSADLPSACGDGRLSAIAAERRVVEMRQAVIATTGQSEVVEVPVAWRASAMDAGRGEVFTVRPVIESDRVMKGWSGSVVRDTIGPLGIVFEVDPKSNEAFVVRVDAIRRLMAAAELTAAFSPKTTRSVLPTIGVLAGATDTATGPNDIFGSGWRVMPQRQTIVFVVVFARPTSIRHLRLASAPGGPNRMLGVGVAAQAGGDEDWVDLGFCRAPEGGSAIACPLLQHTTGRLRLVVKTTGDGPIVLQGLVTD